MNWPYHTSWNIVVEDVWTQYQLHFISCGRWFNLRWRVDIIRMNTSYFVFLNASECLSREFCKNGIICFLIWSGIYGNQWSFDLVPWHLDFLESFLMIHHYLPDITLMLGILVNDLHREKILRSASPPEELKFRKLCPQFD